MAAVKAFSAATGGYGRGEGGCMVVVKRLDDANEMATEFTAKF